MIPVKLTLTGLYSYQQKQTIDFTKLTAANLFGIFGSVGSGKSSILEAITFAIYGKTDRLNLSGDNRNYNMMNLKSNELLIDFEFETGKEQTPFRATVKGKRNSKRFDDVKTLLRSAYRHDGENWIPVDPSVLEEAIGLSYENFKRTVIIPQGQFQEFLQLGNKDRTKMMKELFNLGKFELYYKVASLETKNNAAKQTIEGQLMQLGEINTKNVKVYEEQLLQLNKELADLDAQLNLNHKKELQWQQIKTLSTKMEVAKKEFEKLQKQEPDFVGLEKTIQQYEKCVLQFKNILALLEAGNLKIAKKSHQIELDSNKLEKEKTQIKTKENSLAEIQAAFDNREKLKQQAEELDQLLKIGKLEDKIKKEKSRLSKGSEILKQTAEKVEKLNSKKEDLNNQIKSEELKLPDLNLLSKVKTWYVEETNFLKQKREINEEIVKLKKEQLQLSGEVEATINNRGSKELPKESNHSQAIAFFQEKIILTKTKIKSIEKEEGHLHVKAQLEKYARDLIDGKPCPLCGSSHHPEKYSAADIYDEQNRLKEAKKALENDIEKSNETISKLKELEHKLQFNIKILYGWKTKLEENKIKPGEHIYDLSWPKFENLKAVENAFVLASQLQKAIDKKKKEVEKVTLQLEKAIKNKDSYQTEIEKIKTELTILQTQIATLRDQLKNISLENYRKKSIGEINNEKETLLKQYLQIEKQFSLINRQLVELRKQKDTLSGILSANRKELEQEKENNKILQAKLNQQLELSEYENTEQVKEVLNVSLDIEKQKVRLSNFKQSLAQAQTRFTDLQKEMGSRVYDAETHSALLNEIKANKNTVTAKKEKLGEIKTLLDKLQKDIKSQLSLKNSLDKLELRGDNIKTLKSLFKASGFVNYISSVYLQNLCNAANDRFFQLTRQKLSLEISEDNNFRVRDFLNGGKIRSVKTLSGGQTFQAALSLALALADNIQKITESNQNFFFLDEGFGSLDKEALSVVFDTLKSLRKEDRIVGVISHVEEMQQEIDVHLRIENDEDAGSIVRKSWGA